MVDPSVLLAFVAAVLAVTLAPGPDNTYIAAVALRHGSRAGVVSALGMACGMVVHVTAATVGLATLLAVNPGLIVAVQLAGAGYLGWLALTTLRELGALVTAAQAPRSRDVLLRAFVTNLTNPKVIVFFAAFLPGFVRDDRGAPALQMLTLGCLFLLVGLVCDAAIGVVAGRLGRSLDAHGRAGRTLSLIAACVYAGLAVLLVADAVRTIAG